MSKTSNNSIRTSPTITRPRGYRIIIPPMPNLKRTMRINTTEPSNTITTITIETTATTISTKTRTTSIITRSPITTTTSGITSTMST